MIGTKRTFEEGGHVGLCARDVCYTFEDGNAVGLEDMRVDCFFVLVKALAGISILVETFVKKISQIIQSENGEGGVSLYNQQASNSLGPNFTFFCLGLLGRT